MKPINSYIWVTNSGKYWETRGKRDFEPDLLDKRYSNTAKDFTKYLNKWDRVFSNLF